MSEPGAADWVRAESDVPSLGEYEPFGDAVLSDAERWPTLTVEAAERLRAIREHEHAPLWVHACGDRLSAADVVELDRLHERIRSEPAPRAGGATPPWVFRLLKHAAQVVPHYRRLWRGAPVPTLSEVEPIGREHLVWALADFVPADVGLAEAITATSSGSTGAALVLPQHPVTVAADLVHVRRLVALTGRSWEPDPARLAVLSVVSQEKAFTYASLLSAFGLAGLARVNLHPATWRAAQDRERYLRAANPQILTSTPNALLHLTELDVDLRPIAVVSGAAALTPAVRTLLEDRWHAPVIDIYGLQETGIVAASLGAGEPHVLLPRRQHVELLDRAGQPVGPGERGEIVVTTMENPYLPLVRYRTGDFATCGTDGALHGLDGRAPVRFLAADGTWVDSVNVTQLLQAHGAHAWRLHQHADGSLELHLLGTDAAALEPGLRRLLGRAPAIGALAGPEQGWAGKARRYSTDVPGALA